MTELHHVFDRFVPDGLAQFGLDLPDRWKSKHALGILARSESRILSMKSLIAVLSPRFCVMVGDAIGGLSGNVC